MAEEPRSSRWERFAHWVTDGWQARVLVVGIAAGAALFAFAFGAEGSGPLALPRAVDLTVTRVPADGRLPYEARSGDPFGPGDHLRLAVTASHPGELLVAYVDARGAVSAAWPEGADAGQPVTRGTSKLDGAVVLSDQLGADWLHAVLCEDPIRLRDVRPAGGEAGLVLAPEGCVTATFALTRAHR